MNHFPQQQKQQQQQIASSSSNAIWHSQAIPVTPSRSSLMRTLNEISVSSPNSPRRRRFRNDKYKTTACKWYVETGYCRFGSDCHYAHGNGDKLPNGIASEMPHFNKTLANIHMPTSRSVFSPVRSAAARSPSSVLFASASNADDFGPEQVHENVFWTGDQLKCVKVEGESQQKLASHSQQQHQHQQLMMMLDEEYEEDDAFRWSPVVGDRSHTILPKKEEQKKQIYDLWGAI